MPVKPTQVTLYLENLANTDHVRVIGMSPWFDFNKETRTKSETQLGWNIDCILEKNSFEKLTVKLSDKNPIITSEQLAEAKEPIYVGFTDFVAKFYFSERTKTWEISAKASKVNIVKQPQPPKV